MESQTGRDPYSAPAPTSAPTASIAPDEVQQQQHESLQAQPEPQPQSPQQHVQHQHQHQHQHQVHHQPAMYAQRQQQAQQQAWMPYNVHQAQSATGYPLYNTTTYYGSPHGMYAASSPSFPPGMPAGSPGAAYAYNGSMYSPAQVMMHPQSHAYAAQQHGQSLYSHPANHPRSREASASSALSYGSAGIPAGNTLSPPPQSVRGMSSMAPPSSSAQLQQQSGVSSWGSPYSPGVGHHQWMGGMYQGSNMGGSTDSGLSRNSISQRGNGRRSSRGGAPGSTAPSRGNSFSSSQSTGSFYFPASPASPASGYNAADLSYAPEVAYMGSAYYSVPHMPQQLGRHHQVPANVPYPSGSPHLGMPTAPSSASPSGSSPHSVSHANILAPEAEPLHSSTSSRRTKSSRTSTSGDVRAPSGRNKPEASPSTGTPLPTQTVERSKHVMWVGNVPQDATVKELFEVFSTLPPEAPGGETSTDPAADDKPSSAQAVPTVQDEEAEQPKDQPSEPADSQVDDTFLDSGDSKERRTSSVVVVDTALLPPVDDSTGPDQSSHGVISVFPISRSNCAFVNYATEEHLARAVTYFSGRPVRPQDKRCLPMICRVRKKDDEERAGVAGQRGRGMHVEWVKEHERKRREAVAMAKMSENAANQAVEAAMSVPSIELSVPVSSQTATPTLTGIVAPAQRLEAHESTPRVSPSAMPPPQGAGATSSRLAETHSGVAHESSSSLDTSSNASLSITSTNSSVLRHPAFKVRYFILKSRTRDDLDASVQSGHWATQPHNEAVLDQAFRLSARVILILGANQSGEFYGYARMSGPIRPGLEASPNSNSSGGSSGKLTGSAGSPAGPPQRTVVSPVQEQDESIPLPSGVPATADTSASLEVISGAQMPLMPPDAFASCVASPLQLTPAEEEEPDVPLPHTHVIDALDHPATWPSQLTDAAPRRDDESSRRGATLSPSLLSQLHRPPFFRSDDGIMATSPSSFPEVDVEPATPQRSASDQILGRRDSMADSHPSDNEGLRASEAKRDSISKSHITSPNLSDHSSLGPADSASYDARAAQQLAMRAIIHNLRLDERESTRQAEELEQHLKISEGQSEEIGDVPEDEQKDNVLPASLTKGDPLGRPFPITWLQTKHLPFRRIQHLRNPWRDNRQIKVSRDGTELEPSVGDQLISEWERFVAEEQLPSEILVGVKGKAKMADPQARQEAEEED
ncbi:hypothetical protein CF327_g2208 [Tilletia walkeri]|nr:hypothetical protein CF327_g2208 [Tilletia walkeri]